MSILVKESSDIPSAPSYVLVGAAVSLEERERCERRVDILPCATSREAQDAAQSARKGSQYVRVVTGRKPRFCWGVSYRVLRRTEGEV